jgi:hypothetical protein
VWCLGWRTWYGSIGGFASGGGWSELAIVLWLDGCLGVELRIGLALGEGLCDTWGGSLRLKASMIGCRRAVHLFTYTLAFVLQLRKSTENLRPSSSSLYLSELRVRCCSSLHWLLANNEHGTWIGIEMTDWIPSHVTTLRMRTEMVLEMLVCSPFNHSTRLLTRKNFTVMYYCCSRIMPPPFWRPDSPTHAMLQYATYGNIK